MRLRHAIIALVAMALAIPASADNAQGIADTTITIGNMGPFSGPSSTAFAVTRRPQAAR